MVVRNVAKFASVLLAGVVACAAAYADTVKPAVIYDLGGKFDKSFNEGVFNGATKFAKDTGIAFRDLEIQNDAQREQVLRKFAKDGFSPILMPGFAWATALGKIADEFPNTKFAIIDMVVDKPNVQSMVFKAEEGSFLVGVIAAKTSKTGKVGFVGGMDIPLISAFECGYAQGVKHTDAKMGVIANMTGTTPAAWNDPVKGGELAKAQIAQGADIIYAAAGSTGQGVLKAAADAGKFGIGVDSDQDNLYPGKILTSMLKRVDVATYDSFKAAKDGAWKAGIQVFGLANNGVGYAEDQWNKDILTADAKKAAEAAKADIIAGKISVHDYMSDNKCPV
ncbi:MAG: BMP family ABC transporter substrate-binding protein [Pseudomonadota bacterium]|nr:BMP family ABC transporter substrate-binding protein [Pseudomonadota bacterium]